MKTIRELCFEWNGISTLQLAKCLEAREKERDEAERERVQNALKPWIQAAIKGQKAINMHTLLNAIYPPPNPGTLPMGIYSVSVPDGGYYRFFPEPFTPVAGNAYRRLIYEDEVVGNADVTQDADKMRDPNSWGKVKSERSIVGI